MDAAPANRLLSLLPARSRARFLAGCDRVELTFADILCEAGESIRHVYFPLDGFISLVTTLGEEARLEVGIVGDEGMLGASVHLGVTVASQRAIVRGTGSALRMNARSFAQQCKTGAALRDGMNRYVSVLMCQLAQTAACAHYHLIEERLARWLLLSRDRAHSDRFYLTHELLAYTLGVRRVGVTEAAQALHERGLIDYRRGEIVIRDGRGLEAASCACYGRGKEIYEQLLGEPRITATSSS